MAENPNYTTGQKKPTEAVNPGPIQQKPTTDPAQQLQIAWSAQAQADATPTQAAIGNTYPINANGQAPSGLSAGDQVATKNGVYRVNSVNPDGTYQASAVPGRAGGQPKMAPSQTPVDSRPLSFPQSQTAAARPSFAQGYADGVDYAAEIAKAVAEGNLGAAAVLEQMRNAKIEAQGLQNQYATTSTFAQYLNQISPAYAAQLRNGYTRDTTALTTNPAYEMQGLLEQWRAAAGEQAANQIDYTTEQAVRDLQRAEEDAKPEFQKQRNQTDIDTARALDNSAYYAEARGDRGGIGQAQYNEIQAAALQNRQAINTAQTKLATDTARQIVDLRAKGDYQKADALLQVTQQYLGKLMELRQWGAEYSLNLEQMQRELDQWQKQYDIQVANITGTYNGQPTYAAQKNAQADAQSLLTTAIKMGIMPSAALIKAAGYDNFSGDLASIANLAGMSFSSGGSGGRGSSGSRGGSGSGSGSGSGLPAGAGTPSGDNGTVADRAAAAQRLTGLKGDLANAVSNGGYLEDYTTLASAEKYWKALEQEANGGMSAEDQLSMLKGWLNSGKITREAYEQMVVSFGINEALAKQQQKKNSGSGKVGSGAVSGITAGTK